jgi:hypothetical protein
VIHQLFQAIAAVGQHYTGANRVWATIYNFELGQLESGAVAGTEAQQTRVQTCLRRWTAAPINTDADAGAWPAVVAWAAKLPDGTIPEGFTHARSVADAARAKNAQIEAEIAEAESPRLEAFNKLIAFELAAESTPDRVILACVHPEPSRFFSVLFGSFFLVVG